MPALLVAVVLSVTLFASAAPPLGPAPWGARGHQMGSSVASAGMPDGTPAFFTRAADQLSYLNVEPDRWRAREMTAMDQAFSYDHYIDLENVPDGALAAADRWSFLRVLVGHGIDRPERDVGFLPYHMLELYQRLQRSWARWREAGPEERAWIEARIIEDAGVLGHYVMDASQPHHTTIHYNGWAEGAPNPLGFNTDRDFHARFEAEFVSAHVSYEEVLEEAAATPRRIDDVWTAILDHIHESHRAVGQLYQLDRDLRFDPDRSHPRTVGFATTRLASGARMLRDLWWTAFVTSGP